MSEQMNAQVFYEKEKMVYEKIPMPKVTDTDVLVRVKNVGICGSDISYYYGMSPVGTATGKGPIVLGHEFTGEVVEVGSVPKALGLFKPGDRVVVNPVQFCNACPDCAEGNTHMCSHGSVPGVSVDGAFAEYCVSKYTGLFKLPDSVSYAAGACIEPLACAVNGMNRLDIKPGQFVAVFGPGPIGIWMVELAKKAYGAGRVALVGTRDYRLEAGRKGAPTSSSTTRRRALNTMCPTSRKRSRRRRAAGSPTASSPRPAPTRHSRWPSNAAATARLSSSSACPTGTESSRSPRSASIRWTSRSVPLGSRPACGHRPSS